METLGSIPIIEVPENDFGFYTDESKAGQAFQKAFPKEFKQYSPKTLEKMINGECKFDNKGVLKGSNIFVESLIRIKNLLPEGQYILSPKDFAKAFNKNPQVFEGTYQDLGFAVTISPNQAKNSNALVKKLAKQVRDFGYEASPQVPIFIHHTALSPIVNKNSQYGFIFNIENENELFKAEAFGIDNTTTKFNKYDKNAIPIPKEKRDYTIYSVSENPGVSSVYSNYNQNAYSFNVHLADSNADGRVVVGNVNVPQNFAKIEKEINQEVERREIVKKDLETRIAKL